MNQQYATALNKEECSIQHFLNLHRKFPTRRPQRGLPLPLSSLPGRRKEHLTKSFRNSHLRYALCCCILLICKNSIDLFTGFCYTMDSNRCALFERSIIPWISGPCWTATVLHTLPTRKRNIFSQSTCPEEAVTFHAPIFCTSWVLSLPNWRSLYLMSAVRMLPFIPNSWSEI